ncbi:MAG: hypothetical protein KBT44_07935, partial [Bacteroidales bacterium]|nr:hypothetical protein [Candidatus Equibacterium intestinale]
VNTICKLALSGDKAPVVTGGTNGTITRTGDSYFAASKVNAEGEAVFQIAVPSLTSTSEPRVLTVEQGLDKFKDKNFSKKAVSAATSVNTVCQLVGLPAGALPGVFTVSNDDGATTTPIYFSQGNLWYGPVTTGATSTFNFEANQYDTPGNGTWSTKHISQFYWSKDFEEAVKQDFNEDQPLSGTDVFFTNEIQTTAKDGFKVIVGDKNQAGWRTLSMKEWQYLFYYREMKNKKDRYTLNITYGGEKGLVLYPDDYDGSALTSDTQYSEADFPDDCVFLPNAGYRDGSLVGDVGNSGNYWSSSAYNEDQDLAYDVSIFRFFINELNIRRSLGCSVRLVSEAE